jgi:uncharacterized protein HemY
MRMDLTAILGNDVLAKGMIRRLKREWKGEIERAVNKVKLGAQGQRQKQMDKWQWHLWYKRDGIRKSSRVGPRVTQD